MESQTCSLELTWITEPSLASSQARPTRRERKQCTSRLDHHPVIVLATLCLFLLRLVHVYLGRRFGLCRWWCALDAVLGLDALADEGEDGLACCLGEVLRVEELLMTWLSARRLAS